MDEVGNGGKWRPPQVDKVIKSKPHISIVKMGLITGR